MISLDQVVACLVLFCFQCTVRSLSSFRRSRNCAAAAQVITPPFPYSMLDHDPISTYTFAIGSLLRTRHSQARDQCQ